MKFNCSYKEILDASSLKANPKNPNKHSKEQIERLAKIIEYQGQRSPIVISNQSGFITKGHGRLQAMKKLGWKRVAVDFQDYDSSDQEYADIVADNAIAEWAELDFSMINNDLTDLGPDFDIDLLGLENFEIEVADKELGDEEETPEPPKESKVVKGEVYILGDHRLMCGDSTVITDVEKLMNGENIDLVYTDPPYGVKVVKSNMVGANFGIAKKGNYKEIIGDETTDCAKAFWSTSIAMGYQSFIIWGGNYFTDFLGPVNSWIVWNKRGSTDIKNTFADGELAWSNLGFPLRIHNQLWNGMIRQGEKEKRIHPTQKPIQLAEFCFDLLKNCKIVYDGFGGSGSTLIACEKTNRKCYMMELDEYYCHVILERWQKYTGKQATRDDGKLWDDIKEGK